MLVNGLGSVALSALPLPEGAVPIKSNRSNDQGLCALFTDLGGGRVLVSHSRDSGGHGLVFSRDELRAMVAGFQPDGNLAHLIA